MEFIASHDANAMASPTADSPVKMRRNSHSHIDAGKVLALADQGVQLAWEEQRHRYEHFALGWDGTWNWHLTEQDALAAAQRNTCRAAIDGIPLTFKDQVRLGNGSVLRGRTAVKRHPGFEFASPDDARVLSLPIPTGKADGEDIESPSSVIPGQPTAATHPASDPQTTTKPKHASRRRRSKTPPAAAAKGNARSTFRRPSRKSAETNSDSKPTTAVQTRAMARKARGGSA